uniref:C3H1-type domain-containing protein n=1 Tax=Emiliania huxleyi TaxID=2903 RepID=A0A7S3WJK0_EMIHU
MAWRQEHGKPGHAAPLDGEKDLSWKPGGGGQAAKERAKEMRKYAEQRALQKESEREARRSEKAAAERQLKEIKAAVTSLDISAEDVRPICRFFELGKCNKGAKCKFRHEAAAAAPEGGADAPAPAFDVVAEMPADAWLQVLSRLGVGGACSLAAVCSSLAAIVGTPGVWEEKRANVFGGGAEERGGEERGGEGGEAAARRECCVSEASLHGWARASLEPPSELPLGELTSAAIAGSLGLSTHRGKMVRLWEAKSGRRLGAMALKEQPFGCDVGVVGVRKGACDVAGCRTVAAVGDVDGRLCLLFLEEARPAEMTRRLHRD